MSLIIRGLQRTKALKVWNFQELWLLWTMQNQKVFFLAMKNSLVQNQKQKLTLETKERVKTIVSQEQPDSFMLLVRVRKKAWP